MNQDFRKRIGLVLSVVVAFAFKTVFATVFWSLDANLYRFNSNFGEWDTPIPALRTLLDITVIVFLSRMSVGGVERWNRYSKWYLGKKWVAGVSAVLFSVMYWFSDPVVVRLFPAGRNFGYLTSIDTWISRWNWFEMNDFLAFVPASLLVVGMEMFRRHFVGASNSPGLMERARKFLSSKTSHSSTKQVEQ